MTPGRGKVARNRFGLIVDVETSKRLGRIRQTKTQPEMLVRRALYAEGFRFRGSKRRLPGRPDIVNFSQNWVVFVHGCFWHRHDRCIRATTPKRNRAFWIKKFQANMERDRRAVHQLRKAGFLVLTVWECEAESTTTLTRLISCFDQKLRKRVS
jgi:DNA mismatch endonuclease (patch repair protein)